MWVAAALKGGILARCKPGAPEIGTPVGCIGPRAPAKNNNKKVREKTQSKLDQMYLRGVVRNVFEIQEQELSDTCPQ
jgi:hypothetical protein